MANSDSPTVNSFVSDVISVLDVKKWFAKVISQLRINEQIWVKIGVLETYKLPLLPLCSYMHKHRK